MALRPTSDHAESSALTVVTTVLHVLINIVDVDISTFPLTHPSEFLKVPLVYKNQGRKLPTILTPIR